MAQSRVIDGVALLTANVAYQRPQRQPSTLYYLVTALLGPSKGDVLTDHRPAALRCEGENGNPSWSSRRLGGGNRSSPPGRRGPECDLRDGSCPEFRHPGPDADLQVVRRLRAGHRAR